MGAEQSAKDIFHRAIEYYDFHQWEGFIIDACGDDIAKREQVRELLNAHKQSDSFFDEKAAATEMTVTERPGMQVGPYKLLQEIGEGGFGMVYMAEQQEPVRRKVAFKIIKPGMDTKQVIARFEAERQALAMMDHPNIAKVLDAGATESGRPFFVMELVKGVPITEFCDSNKLSTQDRLELFITVCRAVQHAHQKGVIHRDIKPSNIMVTLHDNKPMPVIIDFGVSKAISHQLTEKTLFTAYGQMVGTPAYMSPEQAQMSRMDIDTRSDIYSLGVVLYELLTGGTPLNASELRGTAYAELQRLIREEEAPKPSTRVSTLGTALAKVAQDRGTDPRRLGQFLRGDLDWIVMKALEKEQSRRYDSANGLANDIQRFLKDEVVEACPPSLSYQVRKFVGRNRGVVATASLVMATVLLGIIGTTVGMLRARHDAGVARSALQEADDARKLADSMADEKQREAQLAVAAKQEADRLHLKANALTAKQLRMRAATERERGDITLAALLGAEALRYESADPDRELEQRRSLTADIRQCPRPTQVLPHRAKVLDVKQSSDGEWLVTACDDGSVRIMDSTTGEVERELPHENAVDAVAFLLNDTRILAQERVEDEDEHKTARLHLWDWRTEKLIAVSQSKPRDLGSLLAGGWSSYSVAPDSRALQIRSAEDGQVVGSLTTEWDIHGTTGFGELVLVHARNLELTEGDNIPQFARVRVLEQQVDLWNPQTDRQLTLLNVPRLKVARPLSRNDSNGGFRGGFRAPSVSQICSPNRQFIALSVDSDVSLYSAKTGELVSHFQGSQLTVDGQPPTGPRPGPRTSMQTLFSADSRTLLCKLHRDVAIVAAAAGEIRHRVRLPETTEWPTSQIKVSADGLHIAALNGQGHVQVWNVESGQVVTPPLEHDSTVRRFDFSGDARYIHVVGGSGSVRVWQVLTGEPATPLMRHAGQVTKTGFSRDGSHLMVAAGNNVHLWPISMPRHQTVVVSPEETTRRNARPQQQMAVSASISPDGKTLVTFWPQRMTATSTNSSGSRGLFQQATTLDVYLWNADTGEQLHDPMQIKSPPGRFATLATPVPPIFSSDGQHVLLVSSSSTVMRRGSLHVLDIATGKDVVIEPDPERGIWDFGWGAGGSVVWTTEDAADTLFSRLWDAKSGDPLGPVIEHEKTGVRRSSVRRPPVSRDGTRLAAVEPGEAHKFWICDLPSGERLSQTVEHPAGPIDYCWFSNHDQYVVSASRDTAGLSICVWNADKEMQLLHRVSVPQGRLPRGLRLHCDPRCQRFAVSGRVGAPASSETDRTAIVGDFASDTLISLHHDRMVTNIRLSPSSNHVLTDCMDGITRVWNAENGQLIRAFRNPGDSQNPTLSRFSSDGKRVIAKRGTGDLQIWNVATGQALTPVLQKKSDPLGSIFSPRYAASLHYNIADSGLTDEAMDRCVIKDGEKLMVYDISADSRPVEELVKMAQVLSGRRINALGNVETLPPQQWRVAWDACSASLREGLLPALRGEPWHEKHIERSMINQNRVTPRFAKTNRNKPVDSLHTRRWHLDRLIELRPEDVVLYSQRGALLAGVGRYEEAIADFDAAQLLGANVHFPRGTALARLKRWEQAAEDFELANSSGFRTRSTAVKLGLAYLSSGQRQKYDQLCERMINKDISTPNPMRLALLVPRDRAYCDRLEEVLDSHREGRSSRGFASAQEMLLYRRGDHDAVLTQEYEEEPSLLNRPTLRSPSLLIRAMAHKRLKHHDQARELLQQAAEVFESESESARPLPWPELQIVELLRREAEELILP